MSRKRIAMNEHLEILGDDHTQTIKLVVDLVYLRNC